MVERRSSKTMRLWGRALPTKRETKDVVRLHKLIKWIMPRDGMTWREKLI